MKTVFSTILCVSVLVGISLASKQDVYGICNYFSQEVRFENKESSGNNCNAPAGGVCWSNGKRAFIPKCESGRDFNNHRFIIHIGEREYSIWKKDSDNAIYGGVFTDGNCRGQVLARYRSGNAWNVVIRPDASVYLIPSNQHCPQAPPPPVNRWDPPQGEWRLIQSIIGGEEITLALSVGTWSTDTQSLTTSWSSSLTASISANLLFGSTSVSSTLSSTIARATYNTLTKGVQTTQSFTCNSNGKPGVSMYQWIVTAGHNGQKTTVANTPNIICIRGFRARAPICPLGACANAMCSVCFAWKKRKKLVV